MTKSEKKAKRKEYFEKHNPIKKLNTKLERLKNFILKNPDYVIFLVQLIVISLMFEKYGLTRTIPLALISSFLLGTFYGYRKRIMLHTIIGLIILSSLSSDLELASQVILIAVLLTFSGIYVARYLEGIKKAHIIKKITGGVISLLLVLLSLGAYLYRFGNSVNYYEAKNKVENYINANEEEVYAKGISYSYLTHSFDYECVARDDLSKNITYKYDILSKEITKETFIDDTNMKMNDISSENESIDNIE